MIRPGRHTVLLAVGIVLAAVACRPITTTAPDTPPAAGSSSVEAAAAGPTNGAIISTLAFDTCFAPTVGQMAVWRGYSPYRAVGIYIGGVNAFCKPFVNNVNLTPAWVSSVVNDQGWRAIPIWVGRQAPCYGGTGPKIAENNPLFAALQGIEEADAAADAATLFGIGPATATKIGSPIYFDLEAYPYSPSDPCDTAVRDFVHGWVLRIHERGYQAGFYSSGASGIANQVRTAQSFPTYNIPDDLWFAHYNGVASAYGSPYVPDSPYWVHRRHHQYLGGHVETYGPLNNRVSINIDSNASDGLAAERPLYRDPNWPLPPKQR